MLHLQFLGRTQLDCDISSCLKCNDKFHLVIFSLGFWHLCSKMKWTHRFPFFPTSFNMQIIPGKLINELGQASADISVFIIRLIYKGYKQLAEQSRLPGDQVMPTEPKQMLSCRQRC